MGESPRAAIRPRAFCYPCAHVAMSGWGCRYQFEDQCLRFGKPCKPGMPGCVLHGKVRFISDLEAEALQKKPPRVSPARKGRRAKRDG
jgi:hypothetical protein